MKLKLFYAPGACSLAPHICLLEAGAEFEAVRVNLREGEQLRPEFRAVNPLGRVPAIAGDQGILTENPAILAWIAGTWPAARLAPLDDAWASGQVNSFNAFIASSVHIAFALIFRPGRYGEGEPAVEAMKARGPVLLRDYFGLIESRLEAGPWVHGEAYSTSDPYLYVMSRWLQAQPAAEPHRFVRVRAHIERMQSRPAVQQALSAEGLEGV